MKKKQADETLVAKDSFSRDLSHPKDQYYNKDLYRAQSEVYIKTSGTRE